MLIRFKQGDPRAGMVARMDSSRARDFIAEGIAEEVSENEAATVQSEAPKVETQETKRKATKAKTTEF